MLGTSISLYIFVFLRAFIFGKTVMKTEKEKWQENRKKKQVKENEGQSLRMASVWRWPIEASSVAYTIVDYANL